MALSRLGTAVRMMKYVSVVCVITACIPQAEATKRFISTDFAYELAYPSDWNLDVSPLGIPIFYSFRPEQGGPQGLFPEDGAIIEIIPSDVVLPITNATTLENWIRSTYDHDVYTNVKTRRLPKTRPVDGVPHDIIRVSADFERDSDDGRLQRDISYYYRLDDKVFRLTLLYWKGNPKAKAPQYESLAESVLRSIRVEGHK